MKFRPFLVLVAITLSSYNLPCLAFDVDSYTRIAENTINEANTGFVANVNRMLKDQDALIDLGIAGAWSYVQQHPDQEALLGLVIDSADAMKKMSLDEIEKQWHGGEFLKSHGFDLEKLDHFGAVISLIDSIVHPATSYISLKEYQRTRKVIYLERAAAELTEVLEHVKHLEEPEESDEEENAETPAQ